jgi:hypothetical protein
MRQASLLLLLAYNFNNTMVAVEYAPRLMREESGEVRKVDLQYALTPEASCACFFIG